MTCEQHLIVFARYPRAGQCKTRLIPALGPDGAAAVHRQLVQYTCSWAQIWQQAARDWQRQVLVSFTGSTVGEMAELCGPELKFMEQAAGDLGQRLTSAIATAIAAGARQIMAIGTDCPQLGCRQVERACDWLRSHDVVIGPAKDGGYYLLGLSTERLDPQVWPQLFQDISWGTDQVLLQTLRVARQNNLRVGLLETLDDIDRPEDLVPWRIPAAEDSEPQLRLLNSDPASPQISVLIPVLHHEPLLALAVASARAEELSGVEILIAAAGEVWESIATAVAQRVPLICVESGRGTQLNAAAQTATGAVLLFLHADTQLPLDYQEQIHRVLSQSGCSGGAFRLQIAANGWAYRLVEWGTNCRSRWWGVPYGDQALFVRRETFQALGGFRDWPLLEDYDFAWRLRRQHGLRIANGAVTTSARRWQRRGIWRTFWRNQTILLGYWLGYRVETLGQWYRK